MPTSQKTKHPTPCYIYYLLLNAKLRKLGIILDSSLVILTNPIHNYQILSILSSDVLLKQSSYPQPLGHYLIQQNISLLDYCNNLLIGLHDSTFAALQSICYVLNCTPLLIMYVEFLTPSNSE